MSITFTPLAPSSSPPAYLLTVDSAKILLDCGTFDHAPESIGSSSSSSSPALDAAATAAYLRKLKELAPTLNLVLLTHPLLTSLGLLPWLKAKCGLRCPVYATLPTREMGRWAVEEWVEARSANEKNEARDAAVAELLAAAAGAGAGSKKRKGKGKEVIKEEIKEEEMGKTEDEADDKNPWDAVWKVTAKEIRDAFLSVNAVRWTQPVHLAGPLKGYTLVAHRSGHTLGGSLYTLRPSLSSSLSPASSSSSLLYAPIFNHVKEHHLDGAALLNGAKIDDAMRRMGVVVVGADRSQMVNVKRVDRERKLLDLITTTMDSGGSILLPTDPSARVLELLVLLESHWSFANLGNKYPLCLITRTGRDVVGFVRSLTEWMGGQIGGEGGGEKVLKFGNLRIYSTIEELNSDIPANVPKTILTVPSTLSHGFSRSLFIDFAKSPNNVVVITGMSHDGTLARWLWSQWNERQADGEKWGAGKVGSVVQLDETIALEMRRKVYLEGEELERHQAEEREAAEREAKHQAVLERSRRMLHADGDSDSDTDDDGEDGSDDDEEQPIEMDGTVARRRTGGFAGGAGAWDEFLDESTLAGRPGGQNFDIYVKGEYGVRRVMEGLPRYRMFPVIERKRRVDAFGEAIDVEGWLKRGVEDDPFGRPVIKAEPVLGKRSREEEEAAQIKAEAPHKYIVEEVQAGLFCSLFVVDMEGASDGRALKTILPQINPRKLVIVSGSSTAVADLSHACKAISSMTEEIYTPDVGELITVGEETKNFSVRLGDSIMASLRMSRVEDYDVAYVSGVIQFDPESDIPVLERTALTDAIPLSAIAPMPKDEGDAEEDTDMEPAADSAVVPLQTSSVENLLAPLQPSLFIGDLRLSLLKEKLSALNVPSEFAGEGVLVCGPAPPESFGFSSASTSKVDPRKGAKAAAAAVSDEAKEAAGGRVAVKKTGRGKLVIEGSPGETYFVVRRIVYSLHAAAG